MEGLRHGHIALGLQIKQSRDVEQAGVAPHAGRDRQGFLLVVAGPQHHGVEGPLVQIVEGRIGGEGAHHVGPAAGQGVGQGQELRGRLADRQDAERLGLRLGQVQPAAAIAEGGEAQLELLLGDGGADQGLQAQHGLGRMQRRRQGQVEGLAVGLRARLADGDHRQAARGHGGLQSTRQRLGVGPGAFQVDDHRFDIEIAQGGEGGVGTTRGDGPPAELVEPFGQRPGPRIVARHDQDSGVHRQLKPPPRIPVSLDDAAPSRFDVAT